MIGIRTCYAVAANVVITASTTLVTVGLTSPIPVNQRQKLRAWVAFSTGAAGGVAFELITPAAISLFLLTYVIFDAATPAVDSGVQTSAGKQGYALANAASYIALIEADVQNGANAGTLDLQFSQNSAADATTILKGSFMEVVTF